MSQQPDPDFQALGPSAARPQSLTGSVATALERLSFPREVDRDFFARVFRTQQSLYQDRLRALGFTSRGLVIDAGCGFGQWSVAAAGLNERVVGVDVDPFRTSTLGFLGRQLGFDHLSVARGSLDDLPLRSGQADAIFCYSAIFMVDFRRAMREAHRVLAPGGHLYFTANSFGWYLHNIVRGQNAVSDFSPRAAALRACRDSARFYVTKAEREGPEVLVPQRVAVRAAKQAGFSRVMAGPEGSLRLDEHSPRPTPLFAARNFGLTSVYEVLCEKGPRA